MAYLLFPVIEPRQGYLEDDPAKLLPELLDQLAQLGDMARHLSRSLGGNGHRVTEVASLLEQLAKDRG